MMIISVEQLLFLLVFQSDVFVLYGWDASDVTWNHEVDTIGLLKRAVRTSVSMLVVDVSLGAAPGTEDDTMAEPVPLIGPQLSRGDLTLDTWLDTLLDVDKQELHGIKLKFQDPDAITPSLKSLRKRDFRIQFPIWLHGDVLDGPVNTTSTLLVAPVAGDYLLKQTNELVPVATVSMGWSTAYQKYPILYQLGSYSWKDVVDMALICRCSRQGNTPKVSFAVRSVFVGDSMDKLKWLLDVVPSSTLTVWSTIQDVVIIDDLLRLRSTIPFSKVYYDLPRYADEEFRRRKDQVREMDESSSAVTITSKNWIVLPYQKSADCRAQPYVTSNSIVLKYLTQPLTFLLTDWYILPLTIRGVLVPYNLHDRAYRRHYQSNKLVLFFSTDSSRRSSVSQQSEPNRWAMSYSAKNSRLFSDCLVEFLVRLSENGVVCSVQDYCDISPGSQSRTIKNWECNAGESVGSGPVNIGFYFEGWRGWALYNLSISSNRNDSHQTKPTWAIWYCFLLFVSVINSL